MLHAFVKKKRLNKVMEFPMQLNLLKCKVKKKQIWCRSVTFILN